MSGPIKDDDRNVTPYAIPPGMLPPSTTTTPTQTVTTDAIAPSEQAVVVTAMDPSHPNLIQQWTSPDVDSNAISSLLDGWIRQIHDQADRIYRELTTSAPSNPASAEHAKWLNNLKQAADDYASRVRSGDPDATAILPYMAASFAIGTTFIQDIVTTADISHVTAIDATSMQKMAEQVTATVLPELNPDISVIVALLSPIPIMKAILETVAEGGTKPQPERNLTFAKKQIENDLTFLFGKTGPDGTRVGGNQELDRWIRAMVITKIPGSDSIKEARQNELVAIVKTVIMARSLGIFYKIETGKITGQEFIDLLNGKINLPPNDPRIELIDFMQQYLGIGDYMGRGKIPNESAALITALRAYMNKNPSVESMLKIDSVFAELESSFQSNSETPV